MRSVQRFAIVACLFACVFVCACGTVTGARDDGGIDVTIDGDVGSSDSLGDAGDAGDNLDAPAPTNCLDRPVRELTEVAMLTNGVWRFTGSNEAEPDGLENAIQPERSDCNFRAVRQQLFRYTMRTRGAFRASTDNPGSRVGFDTVLFVMRPPCTPSPTTTIACNDDNPFVGRSSENMLSLVTTPVLDAGTTVILAVAGFYPGFGSRQIPQPPSQLGTYELSVAELPPVADGDTCDLRGLDNVCGTGSSCIATRVGGDQGACRRDGSVPGAACVGRMTCAGGLACDTSNNTCFETVADGHACDRLGVPRRRCATTATCVSLVRGGFEGRCESLGGAVFTACAAGNVCTASGLVCTASAGSMTTGQCLRAASGGGACSSSESLCPSDMSCVPVSPGADVGRCVAIGSVAGAPCLDSDTECASGLFCVTVGFSDRRCRTVGAADGGACGAWGGCSGESECVVLDPSNPYVGTCALRGRPGGSCTAVGIACEPGNTCTNLTTRDAGRCLRAVPRNGTCDIAGRASRCDTGHTCVPVPAGGPNGTCAIDGTAAGANCRASSPRCDAGLMCSVSTGTGRCLRDVSGTGACDARFATTRCAGGMFCRATTLDAGTCSPATVETEPNDLPEAGTAPATLPRAFRGIVDRYDVDCVTFDVASGGRVFAQATATDGRCQANLAVDLYRVDAELRLLGTDADSGAFQCPRIEGRDASQFPWARELDAGRYAVCVREASSRFAAGAYLLSVSTD